MTTANSDNTQIAAGQLFPEDSNNEFTVITFIVRQMMSELETMTPVQVKTVHAGSGSPPVAGTVDVKLLISTLDGNANAVKPGVVYGVPYFRYQSANWAIINDPAANDFGFIVAASRDMSNVQKNPGQVNPGSFRKYSFSDGIFVPAPYSSALPQATFWLKADGSFNLTSKDGVVLSSDGSGNLTVTGMNAINLTATTTTIHGDLHATGAIIAGYGGADQIGLQTHVHPGNNLRPTPGT